MKFCPILRIPPCTTKCVGNFDIRILHLGKVTFLVKFHTEFQFPPSDYAGGGGQHTDPSGVGKLLFLLSRRDSYEGGGGDIFLVCFNDLLLHQFWYDYSGTCLLRVATVTLRTGNCKWQERKWGGNGNGNGNGKGSSNEQATLLASCIAS